MKKTKTARVAAFIASIGASAALIGAAAHTTGAYFTDSQPGSITAQAGHLKINAIGSYDLSFANLVPGEDTPKTISYSTDTNTPEDVWLYFPSGTPYGQFTGGGAGDNWGANYADGGIGRFGHFQVNDNDGNLLFNSYNVKNAADGSSGCADTNGHGSVRQATSESDSQMGYCGLPHYMLIQSNVPDGATRHFTMTFGLTGRQTQQGQVDANGLPFKVVATQHGVRPDAGNF